MTVIVELVYLIYPSINLRSYPIPMTNRGMGVASLSNVRAHVSAGTSF
jgi:hypothetical protein